MFWWWPFGRVPEVSSKKLHAMLQDGRSAPQLLDVRSVAEWEGSHIAGTLNAPVTELNARLATLGLDPGRPVVAICRSAHRSIPAVRLLQQHGFTRACQLQGGMRAWWKAALPVAGGQPEAIDNRNSTE